VKIRRRIQFLAVFLPLLRVLRLRVLCLLPWVVALPALALAQPTASTRSGGEAAQAQLVQDLRAGGLVVLIRHSETDPGVGDPSGFRPDDCPTQRNLSEPGRAQARRLGQWFRQHEIQPTRVRTSPWCRTRETALLAFGAYEDWPALSNLIGDRSRQAEHAKEVLDAISLVGPQELVVLVSHGVTINAFIGQYLQQGEMVVVRPAARATGSDPPSGGNAGGNAGANAASAAAAGRQGGPAVQVIGRMKVP
jgi:phosphohistidine phosphatase SixA